MAAAEEPQDSAGPSSPPPALPEGWLAQWEGVSRKWYYVQRATGKSQWNVPTEPVILTPSTTPGSIGAGPTQAPRAGSQQSLSPRTVAAESPDLAGGASRGIFSGASSLRPGLSGVLGSGGNSAISQIADKVIGKIAKDFVPGKNGTSNSASQPSYQNQAGQNTYGYASTGQSGSYSGNAPQYYPQGQATSQQTNVPQHMSSAAYSMPSQPMSSGLGPSQPQWTGHNTLQQQQPPYPGYQHPEAYGQFANHSGDLQSQPEWQTNAHPPVPHSTKPEFHAPQHNSHSPAAMSQGRPSYEQQPPQHASQQGPNNAFGHGQYLHQQDLYGNPTIGGAAQSNQQQHPQYQQHYLPSGPQQSPPYHPGAGPIPPAGITNLHNNPPVPAINSGTNYPHQQQQTQPGQFSHHSNMATAPAPYLSNSGAANQPVHNTGFAVELPDNQIHANHPMMNDRPPPGQQPYGQHSQTYPPQPARITPNTHQQMPPNSAPHLDVGPGLTPVRHTPTDPSFVSGPWTSPPPPNNHPYSQNRY